MAILIIGFVAFASAQDQTVSGNLGVSGILDVNGDNFNLGTSAFDTTKYGVSAGYGEDAATHAATLTLTATRPSATWRWQQAVASPGTGSMPKMQLSAGNALTLYDQVSPTPNATIVLDPLGTSSFGTSATFNGANNLMPVQQITGSASVLTVGLADGRYSVVGTGTNLIMGTGASSSNDGAVAMGYQANASGSNSIATGRGSIASSTWTVADGPFAWATNTYAAAVGFNAQASGDHSTAVGAGAIANTQYAFAGGANAQATGMNAVALGSSSLASSDNTQALGTFSQATSPGASAFGVYTVADNSFALAFGYYSRADGYMSSSFGTGAIANGYQSTALGKSSGANGYGSSALGFNSSATGDYTTALGSFSNASGYYSTALSSSSVASGDYSVSASRGAATSEYQMAVGAYSLPGGDPHNWVATDALFTIGNGLDAGHPANALLVQKNGDTTVNGNLNVTKAIIVQPQGDLSMGTFTATPSPTP